MLSEDGGEAVVRRRDDAMHRHLVGDLETGGFAELLYPVDDLSGYALLQHPQVRRSFQQHQDVRSAIRLAILIFYPSNYTAALVKAPVP